MYICTCVCVYMPCRAVPYRTVPYRTILSSALAQAMNKA